MTSELKRTEIPVTAENLWFLERYLNIFDFAGIFPADALAADGETGVPVVLHTDRGFTIETDFDRAKMQLRNRSKFRGWMRWTAEHSLRAGDCILIEECAPREYRLMLQRKVNP